MTFAEFFQAVWGKAPFPWQGELAGRVMQGDWPRSIGLPTAAGKTALIDIAVYALSQGAPRAARRVFFVVDRRVIVDEAAERADALAERLAKAEGGSELWKLAQRLCQISGTSVPLGTAILRGGIPRDETWADTPLQPVVICSTVDQVGSALLFRAYGASVYGRPIRAGMAACDSLVILDEAHTSQPFAETLVWIEKYRGWAEEAIDMPFTVVEMSATPRDGGAFCESDGDRADSVLGQRWGAEKQAKLVVVTAREGEEAGKGGLTALVEALAEQARGLRKSGAYVIGVIANRVSTARRVYNELSDEEGCHAILMTGRARPYDRDEIWRKWKPYISLDRSAEPERPIFVVATQCIEVGANIDFDALVTEIASADALEQRFGRLNRGGRAGLSHAAIVAQKDQVGAKFEDWVYGSTLGKNWNWLKARTVKSGRGKAKQEFVPMGVQSIRSALAQTEKRAELIMPRKSAPVLMPAHMDLLFQTSPEPALSPEPAVYLHGPDASPADVQVVWRQDFEENPALWTDIASVCAPSSAEAIAVPVWAVRKWLARQESSELADVEGLSEEEPRGGGAVRPVLAWRGPEESGVVESASDIRPGMMIVAPASYGGCDEWGWIPASDREVIDIGDRVKAQMGRPVLRLHPKIVEQWKDADMAQRLSGVSSVSEARDALRQGANGLAPDWLKDAVSRLAGSRILKLVDSPDGSESTWAIAGKGTFEQASLRAWYTTEVGLEEHLEGCAELAKEFAERLPDKVRETVIRAAALHDIGKVDPRFQAWLRGGNPVKPEELIAKSRRAGQNLAAIERARRWAEYPKGGRHELLSVALLDGRQDDFADIDYDLLLHLIGSHHGRCRPFAPVVEDGAALEVSYDKWQASTDHGLERAGSGVCERFWRLTQRYGWYGLAYLETLVRLADQRRSEAEEDEAGAYGGAAHA